MSLERMTRAQEVSDIAVPNKTGACRVGHISLAYLDPAEGRARTKFQKSISDGNVTGRRLDSSIVSTKGIAEPRSNFTSRRQSIRDQKAPLGPRPPDFFASKR